MGKIWGKLPRDGCAALAVFAISAGAGIVYMATFDGQAYFAQHMFGPAAMWACGRGFENPMLSRTPALTDFLYSRRDCIDCGEIPADIPLAPWDGESLSVEEWAAYHPHPEYGGWVNCQRFHLYLLGSVAILWRVLGVAWSSLLPLYGLLFGVTGVASYGLFRLMMGRAPAVVFALLFVAAPLHVQQLPDLRDYAKAPFFLTAIFLTGFIAKQRLSGRLFAGVCALCGVVLGIGVGFRQDVLMCIPPFVVVALLLAPGRPLREKGKRLAGVSVFLACFVVVGGPILRVLFVKGNNSSHDTLIGLNKYCSDRLGVGSPVYDFGDPFLDEYTRAVVESYDARMNGGGDRLRHYTAAYDRAGSGYFRELALMFPADLAVRAYASVLRIVDEMRPDPSAPWPRDVENGGARLFYRGYGAVTGVLLTHGRYAMALALLLLGAYDLRLGITALFLLGWFAGYPSLRFSVRHCFHMQIVSYLAAGFLVQRGCDAAGALRERVKTGKPMFGDRILWRRYGFNAGVFALIAVAATSAPLWALRAYQDLRVWELLRTTAAAPVERMEARRETAGDGRVVLKPLGFAEPDPSGASTQTEYLVVELEPGPRNESVALTFAYETEDAQWDFTRSVTAELRQAEQGKPTRVYFPVYFSQKSRFKGVVVAESQAECVTGLYRARDFEGIPVLLTAVLCPGWQDMPLHFRLTR
ncbi:MAG: hypothetical protein NTZ09_01755 [Candidatus Hydrogenedentes bacterium]|nr:hypothetical protein [Candidatus Hydrogenedentota bacterium]